MNDPAKHPIDVVEQRDWLRDHKEGNGLSWSQLANRMDIPQGTLSQFGGESGYKGDNAKVAEKIYRYRQLLVSQAEILVEAPEVPAYFETATSRQLINMLTWAQRGRIVVAALAAGCSKTTTAEHFQACSSNVFMTTMSPSTAGVNNMQIEVLEALGEKDPVGTPQKLSRRIKERVKDMASPLIIIDEAQHLSEKAIEEIRSWHDATGVGIALFGNIGVMQRLEGGSRKAAFAQLFSRVSLRMVRNAPLTGDCDALSVAWGLEEDVKASELIRMIGRKPGGLRGATMALELGSMIASSEGKALNVGHIQDAWAQLSARTVAA